MKRLALVACTLVLSACSGAHSEVLDSVRAMSTDPTRVQFEAVFEGPNGATCGRVNMPNSLGGMEGFKPFVAYPDGGIFFGQPFAAYLALSESGNRREAAEHLERTADFRDRHGSECKAD